MTGKHFLTSLKNEAKVGKKREKSGKAVPL
jgi:hypothetical protein